MGNSNAQNTRALRRPAKSLSTKKDGNVNLISCKCPGIYCKEKGKVVSLVDTSNDSQDANCIPLGKAFHRGSDHVPRRLTDTTKSNSNDMYPSAAPSYSPTLATTFGAESMPPTTHPTGEEMDASQAHGSLGGGMITGNSQVSGSHFEWILASAMVLVGLVAVSMIASGRRYFSRRQANAMVVSMDEMALEPPRTDLEVDSTSARPKPATSEFVAATRLEPVEEVSLESETGWEDSDTTSFDSLSWTRSC